MRRETSAALPAARPRESSIPEAPPKEESGKRRTFRSKQKDPNDKGALQGTRIIIHHALKW